MQSGYTCLRCTRSVARKVAPQSSSGRQLKLPFNSARFVSSASKPAVASQPSSSSPALSSTVRQQQKKSASSLSLGYASRDDLAGNGSWQSTASPLLQPDNLFHPLAQSPAPDMRRRAAFMRQHAYCPHPDHRQTRMAFGPNDPATRQATGTEAPKHVDFHCPDCGIPVYCCEEHWAEDYEAHLEICDTLRQVNEDDHDLRSGRFFPEFEYPGPYIEEALPNMSSWDTLLYTRQFEAINDMRAMRQATKLLTYPLTIGSVIHELSPYNVSKAGRLTKEGLRSLSALRYSLHPPASGSGSDVKSLKPKAPAIRIFVLGARAESSLPRDAWQQLAWLFPRASFHLIFIGPEAMAGRDAEYPLPDRTVRNPFGAVVEDRLGGSLKISTIVDYYHTIHNTGYFAPYDVYLDAFMLFHPGLGHPASSAEWADTLPQLLETKCPIICTGYTEWDMQRDREWVETTARGEYDVLMEPGENIFRSLRWDINDFDPADVSCSNWGVWAFRGKRYEARVYGADSGEGESK